MVGRQIDLNKHYLTEVSVRQEISPSSSEFMLSTPSTAPSTPWWGDTSGDGKFAEGIHFPSSSIAAFYPLDAQQLASSSTPQSPPSMTTLDFNVQELGQPFDPQYLSLPNVYRPRLPNTTPSSAQRSQHQIHCPALQAHAQQYLERLEKITGHGVINHVKSSSLSKKASEKRRTRTKFALCPVEGCDTSFTRTHNINGENSSSTTLVITFSFSFDTYVQVISIIILATCHMYVTRNIATTALHIRSALIDTRNMHTVIPLSQANGVKIRAKAWRGQRRSLS